MDTEHSAILSLVASGRITPREAERLLAAWRDGEDTILRLALCLAFVALLLPDVGNTVTAIGQAFATLEPALERALVLMSRMA
jgi:hypothetical protein